MGLPAPKNTSPSPPLRGKNTSPSPPVGAKTTPLSPPVRWEFSTAHVAACCCGCDLAAERLGEGEALKLCLCTHRPDPRPSRAGLAAPPQNIPPSRESAPPCRRLTPKPGRSTSPYRQEACNPVYASQPILKALRTGVCELDAFALHQNCSFPASALCRARGSYPMATKVSLTAELERYVK